jgi:hypothetical protein
MRPLLVAIGLLASQVAVAQETVYTGRPSSIRINVNGREVIPDRAAPVMIEGRVLVPVRGVLEHLGARIDWFPQHKVVSATRGERTITLGIGDDYGTVNGRVVPLAVPAQIRRGRTMVPLRYLSEALGAYVVWDESRRVVVITTRVEDPPAIVNPNGG